MTVSVNVPRGVFAVVFTVIFDEPGATTEVGLKATVVPAGFPETKNDTLPENPRSDEIDTEYVAVRPRLTEIDEGTTPIAKSGGAATMSVSDALWLVEPLVPETVNG